MSELNVSDRLIEFPPKDSIEEPVLETFDAFPESSIQLPLSDSSFDLEETRYIANRCDYCQTQPIALVDQESERVRVLCPCCTANSTKSYPSLVEAITDWNASVTKPE